MEGKVGTLPFQVEPVLARQATAAHESVVSGPGRHLVGIFNAISGFRVVLRGLRPRPNFRLTIFPRYITWAADSLSRHFV